MARLEVQFGNPDTVQKCLHLDGKVLKPFTPEAIVSYIIIMYRCMVILTWWQAMDLYLLPGRLGLQMRFSSTLK